MSISNDKSLSGAAATVMSALVVSRLTGFVRQMLVPSVLGSNEIGDAYDFAFRITDLMFYLLVGGAISAALIPVLTGYISNNKEKEGWKAVSTFVNTIAVAMILLVVFGIIFAPSIVPKLAIGYDIEADSRQLELVTDLTRILLPSVGILMLAGMVNGILNSYHRFAAAAYGPSLYNILCSFSILFLSRINVQSVAFGVTCSSFIYFLFQLSFALKNMKYYRFGFYFRHPGFRRMVKLAVPSLISSSIAQVNVFITNMFTTLFPAGSIVALSTADKIWQTPYGIFAQGMGTAMLPTLSEKHALGDFDSYRELLMKSLKTVLLLTVPSAAGLIVLRRPVISFFKFSALFDTESMVSAQRILVFFTIALLSQSTVAILLRAFYARNNTKTPLFTGAFTIGINIGLCYFFYNFTNIGVAGMALAYSIASLVNAIMLFVILHVKVKGLELREFFKFVIKISISASVMFLCLYVLNFLVSADISKIDFTKDPWSVIVLFKIKEMLLLLIKMGAGAVIYFLMLLILKVEEGRYIHKTFMEKAKSVLVFISHK